MLTMVPSRLLRYDWYDCIFLNDDMSLGVGLYGFLLLLGLICDSRSALWFHSAWLVGA